MPIPADADALPRPQVAQMSVRVAGDKALPPEVVEQIVAKTDGVPLFVEELTKTVLESGLLREGEERYELDGAAASLAIPTTLHDSLMARLDRLATVKDGRNWARPSGARLPMSSCKGSLLDDATLQHSLWQLVEAELVYQRGRRRRRPTRSSMRSSRTRRINRCCGAPAAVSPAHCAGGGRAVSRDGRDATGTAGASLYRGRAQSPGRSTGSGRGNAPVSAQPMWKRSVICARG